MRTYVTLAEALHIVEASVVMVLNGVGNLLVSLCLCATIAELTRLLSLLPDDAARLPVLDRFTFALHPTISLVVGKEGDRREGIALLLAVCRHLFLRGRGEACRFLRRRFFALNDIPHTPYTTIIIFIIITLTLIMSVCAFARSACARIFKYFFSTFFEFFFSTFFFII